MPIYKDEKRNTYYFRVMATNNKGERKQFQRSGFKTKKEAKEQENIFLNSINKDNCASNKMTFQELYNLFIKHKSQILKPQSIRTLKSKFNNHILPFFKDYDITKINNKTYLEWKDYIIKKGYRYKYNSSFHVCMVSILNYAIKFDYLEKNIASKVGNFSKSNYIPKINYWTYEEFLKFISVVDDKIYNALYSLLYYTGMRLGECLALTWNDIKSNYIDINKTISKGKVNGEYIITTPKTQTSIRTVFMDDKTIIMLNELKDHYKSYSNFKEEWFVFGGSVPLAQTTVGRKKNEYCKKANVKQIKIHDFRHSHATLLISNNTPVTVISERLGHADKSITLNTYSHLFQSDKNKAVQLINNIRKN